MMILMLLSKSSVFSQGISVNNNFDTPQDMVSYLVGNSCLEITNASWSTPISVAQFNQNGSAFPLSEGVVISSGVVNNVAGIYTGNNLSSATGLNISDSFLQNLSNQSSGQSTPLVDVAFLEFDFVPTSNFFSFDFLFASNEYGQFQCLSNDIFAFTLTDLTTNTTVNLAVIPQTGQPIGVRSIRNSAFNPPNGSCNSSNPSLFGAYHVLNPAASYINMRGNTVVLNASSSLIPNNPYRIRMSIADFGDSDFDSAIFMQAGSFNTELNLGDDLLLCNGEETTLSVPFDDTFSFQWFFQGNPITDANESSITINQTGTYSVQITKDGCFLEDSITVNQLLIYLPSNLYTCSNNPTAFFDLTQNNVSTLVPDSDDYQIFYYASQENAQNLTNPIPASQISNFQSSGQSIYIRVQNIETLSFCSSIRVFQLIIQPELNSPAQITAQACESNNSAILNLNSLIPQIIDGQTGPFSISFFNSLSNAQNNVNALTQAQQVFSVNNVPTYWALIAYTQNPSCNAIVQINVTIEPLPEVDTLGLQVVCSEFILPTIENGNYFTQPFGGGTQLFEGDIITQSGIYYIFNTNDAGCFNESSFQVEVIEEFEPIFTGCGAVTITVPFDTGTYYTEPGGPNGTGEEVPPGTLFTNDSNTDILVVNLYYYAEIDDVFCREEPAIVTVNPFPLVDQPSDVTVCNGYVLPPIENGNYYLDFDAIIQLNPGFVVTDTRPIYVYAVTPENCLSAHIFQVNVVNSSQFQTVFGCGSYQLPEIEFGNYYTGPGGTGNIVEQSEPITEDQVVYFYAETTQLPNCTENLSYNIVINPIADIDVVDSGTFCGQFILPVLQNGIYYTLPGGPNVENQQMLMPFQVIDLSGTDLAPGTYYIYAPPNQFGCPNETSFTIDINPFPPADEVIDRIECQPYSVSAVNGVIYTDSDGPNGNGVIVNPSEIFDQDMTFYLYAVDNVTGCVVDNSFNVFYYGIDLPNYDNFAFCESDGFQLPELEFIPDNVGDNFTIGYFWDENGQNQVANDFIFDTAGNYTIYVYGENDARFGIVCTGQRSFTVTISSSPVLLDYSQYNGNYCDSFTLPSLPVEAGFTFNYYNSPNFDNANIISPSDYTFSQPGTYTIYVYGFASNNSICDSFDSFTFQIFPLLETSIADEIVCVDVFDGTVINPVVLSSGINQSQYLIEWVLNGVVVGTGSNFTANETGTYKVLATRVPQEFAPSCNYVPFEVTVEPSSIANAVVNVSEPFEDRGEASVNILNGFGEYQFMLNNNGFQNSPFFGNLSAGYYEVTVMDVKNDCGSIVLPFFIINYPKYFTPNNDGVNDIWNISNIFLVLNEPELFVLDRFGKLLKQIKPNEPGWDGTLNGKQLPSTDYWFHLKFKDDNGNLREVKDHFSLIR